MIAEKRLGALAEGTMFMVAGLTARVLRTNECRTYVQIDKNRLIKIKTLNGEEAEFNAPGARISISSSSMVVPIDEMDDLGADDSSEEKIRVKHISTRGGKLPAAALIRPIKADKKIGKVLSWLLEGPQDINKMANKFEITRACAMCYLAVLHKQHGVGYSMTGEIAHVSLPVGCKDPFKKG